MTSVIRVKISRVNKDQPDRNTIEISYLLVNKEFKSMKETEIWLQKYWKKRKEKNKKTFRSWIESLFKVPNF